MKFDVVVDMTLAMLATTSKAAEAQGNQRKCIVAFANDFENKLWRYERFLDFIWDNVAQTSLSAKERASLSAQAKTTLRRSAMNLRLTDNEEDPGRGSEIAEIALYAVMKHHYNALPIVPKIFYKQNKNDNAKGADSVHIVVAKTGDDFTLWFGESKFYSDIGDARLDKVVQSVADTLSTDKIKKENSIIVGLSDLRELVQDVALLSKIEAALDADRSIDAIKPRLHVPILLLYECTITAQAETLDKAYLQAISDYSRLRAVQYFARQEAKLEKMDGYKHITFHLIVFPVPDKKKIVKDFLTVANLLKGGPQ